ncbi:hypothetical protein Tco_1114357 [Tanacetum coccineum]|uniref:Uncharacterized protein n=1 Tax=Tanacetum coccineum TaxID=301880 RepID=A0ABQ5IYJ3_9ASTR
MEILVKTCLMPLALKTQNDSFAFVHELKQEMHADLKYVESLKDELDELESDKEISNMYDMSLARMCGIDCLAQKLSEQTDLFEEIKEMSETSVANDTSGLVPQRQKASDYDNPDPAPELQNVSPSADTTVPSQQELDLLFGPLYDEFFNDGTSRVNKSSSPTDNSAPQDHTALQTKYSPYIRTDNLNKCSC